MITARDTPYAAALAFLLTVMLAACSQPAPPPPPPGSEPVGGVVIAPHSLAAEAGRNVLRVGGSAADAAVAMAAVLSVVAPDAAGFGGGGVALHYDARTGAVEAYDGLMRAPATPNAMRAGDDGGPRYGATAAPGLVDMLAVLHADYGVLSWEALITPAAALADNGAPVGDRLAAALVAHQERLQADRLARTVFLTPQGAPLQAGDRLRQRALARTLRDIARDPDALYNGRIANALVAAAQTKPERGALNGRDLARYRGQRSRAICMAWGARTACGAPPPTVAGVEIAQTLAVVRRHGFDAGGPNDRDNWALWAGALQLARADRDAFLARPGLRSAPVAGLLNPQYLAARADGLDPHGRASARPRPGDPWAFDPAGPAAGARLERRLTPPDVRSNVAPRSVGAQILAVDGAGDAVAMTVTLGAPFGFGVMAAGLMLNDAATTPDTPETAGARIPIPAAPLMVLGPEGELLAAINTGASEHAAGASALLAVAVTEWATPARAAVALAQLASVENGLMVAGAGEAVEDVAQGLRRRGFEVARRETPLDAAVATLREKGWDAASTGAHAHIARP